LLKASGTFWLYGIICLLGFLFILKRLPETKGKSLEEIENLLTAKDTLKHRAQGTGLRARIETESSE
jgi:hypothetical protein